jgi:trans-aconitate methyltransferase
MSGKDAVDRKRRKMKWDSALYDTKHSFVAQYGLGLLEFVPQDENQRILDIGCGTGVLTAELAKHCVYVLGIDSSADMIEKARAQYPALDFKFMNALELPFEHEWDVVFSNAVFHWIIDHDLLLNKIRHSLKSSGVLVCEFGAQGNIQIIEDAFSAALQEFGQTYHSKWNFPSVEAFSAMLEKNGFSIERVYAYDRPTPLKDGEQGLRNWVRQFFAAELEKLNAAEQDKILQKVQSSVKAQLWNGQEWTADYIRLRTVARAN